MYTIYDFLSNYISYKMDIHKSLDKFIQKLGIPALQVFLGAYAQLLRISLAGARMPLSVLIISMLKFTWLCLAQHHTSWTKYIILWPLFWPLLAIKAKTN